MIKSDCIVIIPTYNEKENIEKIIRAVMGLEKAFNISLAALLLSKKLFPVLLDSSGN